MLKLVIMVMTLAAATSLAGPQSNPNPGTELLETGQAAKISAPSIAPGEITVVSYNIRWRTGAQLKQISDWLKTKNASIIALQEVDRARERTQKRNHARELAESLGMYYAWTAPPATSSEEETGVELLSPYQLGDVTRIVLPHKGPGGRLRVALGATIKRGKTSLRCYSVHSETRISTTEKIEQYRAVLADLARFPKSMPAVVMGDLNSWEEGTLKGVRKLFADEGFSTPFPDNEETFKRGLVVFDLELKLDWIWLRGLTARSHGIDKTLTVSDHFPLWTVVTETPAVK